QFLNEVEQSLFQIGKRYIFIHIKSLDLMEETMCTCRNSLIAVHPARHNGTERWLACFHQSNLNGRGMRTQGNIITILFLDKESILHITRRVLRWKIQGREVVPVIFDLRSFGNDKTEFLKNLNDLLADQRQRMARAQL